MKKSLVCVVAVACLSGQVLADGFHGVFSSNGTDVIAVGNAGLVFTSADGGVTWTASTAGSNTLRAVYAIGSTVWAVGDNASLYTSTDNGQSWTISSPGGTSDLYAVAFATPSIGIVAGAGGTVYATVDGGASWQSKSSGTSATLRAVAYVDPATVYAAGDNGTLLKTVNAGATWTILSATGPARNLTSVSAKGSVVYVTGVDGVCEKSTDGGLTWSALDFRTDSWSDVNDVFMFSADSAFFVGGGGYIRKTVDGGESYTWGKHGLHAVLNDIYFLDEGHGWAVSEKNNVVLRTSDGGENWSMPQGTTVSYSWSQKFSSGSIGNTFVIDPWNKNRIFVAMSNRIYVSDDRGETWSQVIGKTAGGGSQHSFYISPRDSNIWVVASTGSPEGVKRSTNAGVTWDTSIVANFTSYGMPLEMDPVHPDTLLYAPDATNGSNGVVYRSTDFGKTWRVHANTSLRSPCDIVIVPDSCNIVYIGDGTTGSGAGQMWRSTDGGLSFASIYSVTGSEIPMIGVSRLRRSDAFATAWGSGGVMKTSTLGSAWASVASTGSTWGVDVAKDDPNVTLYGVYGGQTSYLSTNAGTTFQATSLSGSNSAVLCYDRSTFLVHQAGNGVWKYNITYAVPAGTAQALALLSPNGGESWQYNTTHNITWSESNIANLKIEYKTGPGQPWQTIAASTPGSAGSYAWLIPNTVSDQALVRISDVLDSNPVDTSNAVFSITAATMGVPEAASFGVVPIGSRKIDTLRIDNYGTAPLVVSSATIDSAAFTVSRSSFTIPAGSSDTIKVSFRPTQARAYSGTLTLANNSPSSPVTVYLSGTGDFPNSVAGNEGFPTTYALDQNFPNPFNPTTVVSYAVPAASFVTLKVYNALGQEVATLVNELKNAGRHSVTFNAVDDRGATLPTGLYFYRMKAGNFVSTQKMILLK